MGSFRTPRSACIRSWAARLVRDSRLVETLKLLLSSSFVNFLSVSRIFEMSGALFHKMNGRTRGRTSDEVPFLADEEKDSLDLSQSPARRDRWAKWLLLSSVLNITLLIPIFANWRLLGLGPKKAYIPHEIYCEYYCHITKTTQLTFSSTCTVSRRV